MCLVNSTRGLPPKIRSWRTSAVSSADAAGICVRVFVQRDAGQMKFGECAGVVHCHPISECNATMQRGSSFRAWCLPLFLLTSWIGANASPRTRLVRFRDACGTTTHAHDPIHATQASIMCSNCGRSHVPSLGYPPIATTCPNFRRGTQQIISCMTMFHRRMSPTLF